MPNVSLCEDAPTTVHYSPYAHDYSQDYLTFVAKEDSTFKLVYNSVSYSLDEGETWTELASNTDSPTVTSGNKIMWKATLTPNQYAGIGEFSSTGQFDVQGNIMSLLYGDNFKEQTSLSGKNGAFAYLFSGCTNLVSAKNLSLPATTLAESCYNSMFYRCTSLTTVPKLPATTLVSACYNSMFSGCTSLTTAPELPATTLADYCYSNMFQGCKSLTTAPELPATTLANGCYNYMFAGCTSLTTAPELPATTLAKVCYNSMFSGCTSLTTAPELPATTLTGSCYTDMFNGCSKLNYIKAMFTTEPSSTYTSNWVNGVASSGAFVKNSTATWTSDCGPSTFPCNWTVDTASS